MNQTVITIYYGGEWKEEEGSYRWVKENNQNPIALVIDTEIKFADLINKLYLKLEVDRSKTCMKMVNKSNSVKML